MRVEESVEIAPTGREEVGIIRIGAVAGIVGSLLAMVGNLLHPATPIADPQGWPKRSPRARDGCPFTS